MTLNIKKAKSILGYSEPKDVKLIILLMLVCAVFGIIEFWGKEKIKTKEEAKRNEDKRKLNEAMLDYASKKRREDYEWKSNLKAVDKEKAETETTEYLDYFDVPQESCLPSYYICGPIKAGHTVLLYGSTGCGKSIAGNQLGICMKEAIKCHLFFTNQDIHRKQEVYVYDAELSQDDLTSRGYGDRIKRANYFTNKSADCFFKSVAKIVDEMTADSVVIVDNVTVGIPDLTQWKSIAAQEQINSLRKKANEKGYHLTLVFIAHSDTASSFKLENMKGFKTLEDVSNLIFEIEPTGFDPNQKVIKMMKNRSGVMDPNVYLLQIVEDDFLHFEVAGTILEHEAFQHVDKAKEEQKEEEESLKLLSVLSTWHSKQPERDLAIMRYILQLSKDNTKTEAVKDTILADEFELSESSIRNFKSKMITAGLIEKGSSKRNAA